MTAVKISISISQDLLQKIDYEVSQRYVSRSDLLRVAATTFLKDLELPTQHDSAKPTIEFIGPINLDSFINKPTIQQLHTLLLEYNIARCKQQGKQFMIEYAAIVPPLVHYRLCSELNTLCGEFVVTNDFIL